jgi:ketosteroid isomerase-like protein
VSTFSVRDPDHLSPRAVIEQLLAGIAAGPSPVLADLYAEDAVVELPFARPGGLLLNGRAEIRQHFVNAAQAPLRLTPVEVTLHGTTDPELIVAEYDYDGQVLSTGRRFRVANVQILRVRAGLIVASRDFHDHAGLAAAVRGEQ